MFEVFARATSRELRCIFFALNILEVWKRRPDLNRGLRFCRLRKVVDRVVSCWSLARPATSLYRVFGRNWTTSGLQALVSKHRQR